MRIDTCIQDEDICYVAKFMWFSPLCYVEMGKAWALYNALTSVIDLHVDNMNFICDSRKVLD